MAVANKALPPSRNPATRFWREIKQQAVQFAVALSWSDLPSAYAAFSNQRQGSLGITSFNYAQYVGDGRGSAMVMACVMWMTRTFPEAPVHIVKPGTPKSPDPKPIPGHPMAKLIRRPNNFYSGTLMWQATVADWMLTGNAYWIKVRDKLGRVVQLWWVPSGLITPSWNDLRPEVFLTHYEYQPNPKEPPTKYSTDDIIHFRYGLDSASGGRYGISPLSAMFKEIFTDEEASNYTAALLRNIGVPSVIISPDSDEVDIPQGEADRIKTEFKARFSGDNRGDPMVVGARIKATKMSFTPEELDLKAIRRIPEERVSAIFGVPAVVVGLGAGLDRSTFANFKEAREAAYESNIIPTQRLMAEELQTQLLPDFVGEQALDDFNVEFDISKVRVLQDDRNKLFDRMKTGVSGRFMKINEARTGVGLPPESDGDVYILSTQEQIIPADQLDDISDAQADQIINPPEKNAPPGRGPTALPSATTQETGAGTSNAAPAPTQGTPPNKPTSNAGGAGNTTTVPKPAATGRTNGTTTPARPGRGR